MLTWASIEIFASAFAVSALSGLAALLRSSSQLNLRGTLSASLNGGFLGLGISLLWYTKFADNLYFLIGVCVIAGLSGPTTINMMLETIQKKGLAIVLGKNGSAELPGLSITDKPEEPKGP